MQATTKICSANLLLQLLPTQVQPKMHFPAVFGGDDHETMLPPIKLELNQYMELLSHLLKRESRLCTSVLSIFPLTGRAMLRATLKSINLDLWVTVWNKVACHPEILNWEVLLENKENFSIYWVIELLGVWFLFFVFLDYFILESFLQQFVTTQLVYMGFPFSLIDFNFLSFSFR